MASTEAIFWSILSHLQFSWTRSRKRFKVAGCISNSSTLSKSVFKALSPTAYFLFVCITYQPQFVVHFFQKRQHLKKANSKVLLSKKRADGKSKFDLIRLPLPDIKAWGFQRLLCLIRKGVPDKMKRGHPVQKQACKARQILPREDISESLPKAEGYFQSDII